MPLLFYYYYIIIIIIIINTPSFWPNPIKPFPNLREDSDKNNAFRLVLC